MGLLVPLFTENLHRGPVDGESQPAGEWMQIGLTTFSHKSLISGSATATPEGSETICRGNCTFTNQFLELSILTLIKSGSLPVQMREVRQRLTTSILMDCNCITGCSL